MFKSVGRNPLLGLFVAFVAVAAGFSANVIVSLLDVLLAGFTIPAAESIDANIVLTPAMNLYFIISLTFILSIVGYFVTEKIVAPRVEAIPLDQNVGEEENVDVTPKEKTALKWANLSVLIFAILLVILSIAPLNDGVPFLVGSNGSIIDGDSTFMRGLVPIVTLLFFIPGLVYGRKTGQIQSASDAVKMISSSLGELGGYILLAFVASQFIALFNQSHLGIIIAVNGAHLIQNIGLSGGALIVVFILFTGLLNIFIGSASAKWAMLAPIFVPMFMLVGYEPALTQMAFRIGDSMTNPISPLFPYFPMIIGFAARYKKDIKLGTIISITLPYSIAFGIAMIAALLLFMYVGIPLGPA
jgi:aminobenzoyl-glutamate transport protein